MIADERSLQVEAAIDRIIRLGPSEAMRECERAVGNTVIRAGERPWFPADDWSPGDVVSIDGGEVRIVAIVAKRPRSGALSRMLCGITLAGLRPAIVEPMDDMVTILSRWGWEPSWAGEGFGRQAIWRPRR